MCEQSVKPGTWEKWEVRLRFYSDTVLDAGTQGQDTQGGRPALQVERVEIFAILKMLLDEKRKK